MTEPASAPPPSPETLNLLGTSLGALIRRPPLAVPPVTSIRAAAQAMREAGASSVMLMEGDRLVVHTPDLAYRVSLGATRAFRRKADGSVLIVTPQRVNDTLIVPRDAQGRYWVDGAEGLIGQIEGFVDIQEVKSLLVLPQGDP